MEHKQPNIEGLHPVAREYRSEHRRNEKERRLHAIRGFLASLLGPIRALVVLAVIFYIWVLVSKWDQEAFVVAVDDWLRQAAEQADFRPYFTTAKHCRVPFAGEVLVMQLAKPDEPGKGFRCSYVTDLGYSSAPRYSPPYYSRGLKSGRESS